MWREWQWHQSQRSWDHKKRMISLITIKGRDLISWTFLDSQVLSHTKRTENLSEEPKNIRLPFILFHIILIFVRLPLSSLFTLQKSVFFSLQGLQGSNTHISSSFLLEEKSPCLVNVMSPRLTKEILFFLVVVFRRTVLGYTGRDETKL
jgi:hypothetical protein